MKAILIALVCISLASAAVHPYFAESNYICELCKHHSTMIQNNDMLGAAGIMSVHPKLAEILAEHRITSPESCEFSAICNEYKLSEESDSEIYDQAAMIESVNSKQTTWVAGGDQFHGMKVADIKSIMGTIVDPEWSISLAAKESNIRVSVPDSFDVLENWPKCASISGHIRDQANCGSCWAHGTTEALNDRRCIAGKSTDELLSVADTTGCCGFLSCQSMGCNGGQVGTPWAWFKNTGVVTGGDFENTDGCYPYTMPACAHHVTPVAPMKDCSEIAEVAPKCTKSCSTGNKAAYSGDKKHGTSSYSVGSVDAIKQDLVTYGSVTAAFTVYDDFPTYTSGIYTPTSTKALGGHAVKIVGYGTEGGVAYWRVANSWNPTWGDKGYFKIKQGVCGIDSQCHAGKP